MQEMRTPTILETDDQDHLGDQEGREIRGDHREDPEIREIREIQEDPETREDTETQKIQTDPAETEVHEGTTDARAETMTIQTAGTEI